MADDSVRNIGLTQSETINKIEHSSDKPMKRDKRQKGYNTDREKDKVEIKSQKLSQEPKEDNHKEEENYPKDLEEEKKTSIDILVK